MNFFLRILITLFIFSNLSCRDSNAIKRSESINTTNQENLKQLVVDIRFKTDKQDVFKISLLNIEVDPLQKKSIEVFERVEPSTNDDVIIAKFDPGNISKDLIINLGGEEEKSLELKKILISYGEAQVNIISPNDFNKHLIFNKFIERDSLSKTIITKRINGRLNPVIRIKRSSINFLNK